MTGVGMRRAAAEAGLAERDVDAAFAAVWRHLVDLVDPVDAPDVGPAPLAPADAVFCFGSLDLTVPEHAATLHARGLAPLVVVTGGGPVGGGRREADAFAADLVARGVPADAVVVERGSRHTGENVVAGVAALAEVADVGSVLSVSWPLAARRCRATFARHHPELVVASSPAIDGGRRWPATERTVRAAVGELDRLRDYVGLGYLTSGPIPDRVAEAGEVLRGWLRAGTGATVASVA